MSKILLPEDVPMRSHAEIQRRNRKITVGEAEDTLNLFAQTMLNQFGPVAVGLRDLQFRVSQMEKQLSASGDIE